MPPTRNSILLTLVQCGETSWDAERRLRGVTDLPLSQDGRTGVISAAAQLEGVVVGNVYHASDEAAAETAQIIGAVCQSKVKVSAELADPDLGLLEGLTLQVFAERYPKRFKQWQDDPLSLTPPEGEDLIDARCRILNEVARLLRRSRADQVCMVLRPLGIGFLRCWLADRKCRDLQRVIKCGSKVERYALTGPMIQWLEEAAAPVASRT